jgi:hypothetical protein
MSGVLHRVDVVVSLWIDEDADPTWVVQEMDYEFRHPDIKEAEIIDVITEF